MPVMDLDFYGLVRPVQERFIASTRGLAVPTPLAMEPASLTSVRPWLIASVLDATLLIVLTTIGFGNLDSNQAIASVAYLVIYVALLSIAAGCLLKALALRHKFASLPFRPGTYLFPIGVVEARSSQIKLHTMLDLDDVQAGGRVVRLSFAGGHSFEFKTRGESESAQLRQVVLEAKKTVQLAEETGNRRELARLDPVRDNGFSNPFGPTGAFRQRSPAWAKAWIGVALAIGLIGGFGLWKTRNMLSESRLFSTAVAKNSVEGFQAYLQRGGTRAEVKEILLPRAELKRAQAEGTVEAIESYIAKHPTSRIGHEVQLALRSTLLSALEQAKAQGTITAIRGLRTQYKNSASIEAEIVESEHEVFLRSFEEYRAKAPTSEKANPVPFFQRLFAYLEHHGPKVEVRWRRRARESVRQADNLVKLSAYFMGNQSIPSQYFDVERSRKREAAATQKLLDLLQPEFPADVLHFEVGEPFDAPEPEEEGSAPPPLPIAQVPTVFITHILDMSGGYMMPNPRGIYVGVSLQFEVAFAIPGDQQPLPFKFSVWRPPNLVQIKQDGLTTEQVYTGMADPAFELFAERYAAALVKPKK